jgi:hypothetical protein
MLRPGAETIKTTSRWDDAGCMWDDGDGIWHQKAVSKGAFILGLIE